MKWAENRQDFRASHLVEMCEISNLVCVSQDHSAWLQRIYKASRSQSKVFLAISEAITLWQRFIFDLKY